MTSTITHPSAIGNYVTVSCLSATPTKWIITDPRLTKRIMLLGAAIVVLAFSSFFLSRAQTIMDYGWAYVEGIGCDTCEFSRQSLLNYSLIFGVIGGILGSGGIWFIAKKYKLATLPR